MSINYLIALQNNIVCVLNLPMFLNRENLGYKSILSNPEWKESINLVGADWER